VKKPTTTSKDWIERGPLVPWMFKYVCWLAEQPEAELSAPRTSGKFRKRSRPYASERAAKATSLAHRRIPQQYITKLEQREDVIEYFNRLRTDAQFKARELVIATIQRNLDLRDKGLSMAEEAGDYRAIETFTKPFVDLALPKQQQPTEQKPRITINLIGNQDAQKLLGKVLADEPDEVDFEVIETKKDEDE